LAISQEPRDFDVHLYQTQIYCKASKCFKWTLQILNIVFVLYQINDCPTIVWRN